MNKSIIELTDVMDALRVTNKKKNFFEILVVSYTNQLFVSLY